jgi:hypothetical protein
MALLEVMPDWMDQQGVGKIWCFFLSNFSAKNLLINSLQAHQHIRLLPILFIISQWVYHMIIQAHLGIIMALLEVMLDWMDQQGVGQELPPLVQLFSQKPPDQQPSSTSAHQIAAHPFHHLPNGSTR